MIGAVASGLVATAGMVLAFHGPTTAQQIPSNIQNWPGMYLGDPGHANFNPSEMTITPTSAASLAMVQSYSLGTGSYPEIVTQPIIANQLIYVTSWDGNVRALEPNGQLAWQTGIGWTWSPTCQTVFGPSSTPAIATVNGVSTLFVGGGNDVFYALNALTGQIIWQTPIGTQPNDFIWASPVIYNGNVYIGMASFGDCPLVAGRLVELSASTGTIEHVFFTMTDPSCLGGGIWASPTIDTQTGIVYIATGNNDLGGNCSSYEPLANSLIALNASDLSLIGSWTVPVAQQPYDGDFGATPTLFTAVINGTPRRLVGLINKNGIYYAFDRSSIASGPIWSASIAENWAGSIASSAWDGSTLYVAGLNTTLNGDSCAATINALDPATGHFLWQTCLQNQIISAPLAVPGLVIVEADNTIQVFDAKTGASLYVYTNTDGGAFWGPATVSAGILYAGNNDGSLYTFRPTCCGSPGTATVVIPAASTPARPSRLPPAASPAVGPQGILPFGRQPIRKP
jgi:polyvinyl alcohol dehydrogenase (cytochrome)